MNLRYINFNIRKSSFKIKNYEYLKILNEQSCHLILLQIPECQLKK